MRSAYDSERCAHPSARAEPLRGLDMTDRDIGLARPQSNGAANVPTAREIRVQRERTINQRHHGADVLTEIGQRLRGIRESYRIVPGHLGGSSGEIGTFQTVCHRIVTATVK